MNIVKCLTVISALAFSAASFAENGLGNERKQIAMVETESFDTVMDIPLRVGGFIATVVGTGLFIGSSPVTGLMTAIHPHNAIEKAADFLVLRPAHYTFVRPTGNIHYVSRPYSER